MNASFNLIDQPWIPCVTVDGDYIECGLHDLMRDAHLLRAISCETPLMSTAILPVTLVILYRAFGPITLSSWENLWDEDQFPVEPIREYFETWYERFDLFHPERPFYQAEDDRVKPKSAIHLVHSIGNTGTLFTHATDKAEIQLSPAQAARYLITARSFRTAGLSGLDEKFTDSPWTRGVLHWAQGNTVFETLMLNLLPYPDEHIMQTTNDDRPAWEMDNPFQKRTVPYGYLDYLTWSGVRIKLLPEQEWDTVMVKTMTVAPALNLDAQVFSPQKRYRKREKKGEVSWPFLYFNPDKSLWRDYHSLLMLDRNDVRPPAVVEWLAELTLDGVLNDDQGLQLTATGMLADQAKPIFYRQEPMPLPTELLRDATYHLLIAEAIDHAEAVAKHLDSSLKILAEEVLMRGADRKPDPNDRRALMQQWDVISLYWNQLEPHFWEFISRLMQSPDEAIERWQHLLRQTAIDILAEAVRMAGTSPWVLKGQVNAERVLHGSLNKLFNIQPKGGKK